MSHVSSSSSSSSFSRQSWQSLSGPSGYEDLNKIRVAPYYSFDATKRAISALKLQVEEVSKVEMSKISGAGEQTCLFSSQIAQMICAFFCCFLICCCVCAFLICLHSEGSPHHRRKWRKKVKKRIRAEGGTKDKRRTKSKRRFLEMWVTGFIFVTFLQPICKSSAPALHLQKILLTYCHGKHILYFI